MEERVAEVVVCANEVDEAVSVEVAGAVWEGDEVG